MNKIVILLGLLGFIVMADNWVVSPILPCWPGPPNLRPLPVARP